MSLRRTTQRLVLLLDRPGGRWLISLILPMIGRRSPEGVRGLSYQAGWVHRFQDAIVVEPEPRARSGHFSEARNIYTWGLLYTPKEGDTVVDVGAGLGSESLYYARKIGATGRLLAIEAHPQICAFLERTMDLNGFKQASVLNVAVADRPQTVEIENDMEHHLGNAIKTGHTSDGITVDALPLDDICQAHGIDMIDFLKMNIEGAERLALGGMERIIQRTRYVSISCHDFKYLETGNEFFRTKEIVERFLTGRGFLIVPRPNEKREIADQVNAYNPRLTHGAPS